MNVQSCFINDRFQKTKQYFTKAYTNMIHRLRENDIWNWPQGLIIQDLVIGAVDTILDVWMKQVETSQSCSYF